MANEVQIYFGSLNLATGNLSCSAVGYKENMPVKIFDIPKMHGSICETAKRKSLIINVEGDISGADYDALRTNIDGVKAALYNGIQSFTTDNDRYIKAQLKNLDIAFRTMRTIASFKASFEAHYPFWLASTGSTSEKTEGVDITSGVGYTVNNAGNAPARVKIEFTAPAGGISNNLQLENTTRGELLRYVGDIAAADVLEIDNRYDSDDIEILNDGSDAHTDFEGDLIMLSPGNNTIEFTGEAGTAVKLYWRATYY